VGSIWTPRSTSCAAGFVDAEEGCDRDDDDRAEHRLREIREQRRQKRTGQQYEANRPDRVTAARSGNDEPPDDWSQLSPEGPDLDSVPSTRASHRSHADASRLRRHVIRWTIVLIAIVALAVVLHELAGSDGFSLVDASLGAWTYVAVFFLVFGDAICALLPGETTLNAASTLAAEGSLDLALVMLAGALGAVTGDSALYWIARLSARRIEPQLEKARANPKIAAGLRLLGTNAHVMLVAGRYVPGFRFVVSATLGLSAYPYRQFLLWSSIGGTLWAVYTCGLAYLVGTALAGFPLASVVISGAITTAAIAGVFLVVRHRMRAPVPTAP
jgi:membrane-associated protein